MSLKLKFLTIWILIFSVFSISSQALGATSPSSISLDISPQSPKAGEPAVLTLNSYVNNLDGALISWFVDGKKLSSEIGLKSFIVVAPQNGLETTVRAVIALPDGDIEKKTIIKPTVLTLLWEVSDAYAPPFYRGKILPIPESTIKVVAIPETKNNNNLIYDWKLNYKNDPSSSGYGKNVTSFINDYLENSDNISVTISSLDGNYITSENVSISASVPQLSFYKNDSLMGIMWDMALQNGHRIQGEEIIVAAPYFISPKELWNPSLTWNWLINGASTTNFSELYKKNWLPIKIEGGVSGVANIGLQIENNNQFLQGVDKQINVEF